MKKYLCICFFYVNAIAIAQVKILPQTDSIQAYNLSEINITTQKLDDYKTGIKTMQIDTLFLQSQQANSIADILSKYSQIFIKSYGAGGLASAGFRGSSANHTAVLWNGLNLQSPMLGQLDFALLPAALFDNVSIGYGSTASLYGSGAVGGLVQLNNEPSFNSKTKVQMSYTLGSFNNHQQIIKINHGGPKSFLSLKLFNQSGKNDYVFLNNNMEQKQTNAALSQQGFLLDGYININKKNQLQIHWWSQISNREIPPAININDKKSFQYDESHRGSIEWKYIDKKYQLNMRQALLNEHIIYNDTNISQSQAKSTIYSTYVENFFQPKRNHFFQISSNINYTQAKSDAYENTKQNKRIAIIASYKITAMDKKIAATIGTRKEIIDDKFIPFVSSLGLEYNIYKNLTLLYNINQSYRQPTFNELYWFDANARGT